MGDAEWSSVTDGMWYVLVPVRARDDRGSPDAMHNDLGLDSDSEGEPLGEPQAELDVDSLESNSLFSLVRKKERKKHILNSD